MWVTINTDASFHPSAKIGGYAFWIVYNGIRIKAAGSFKEPAVDPTECELRCILNCLHVLGKTDWHLSGVYLNTDSLNSIYLLTGNAEAYNRYNLKRYKKYRKAFNKIAQSPRFKSVNFNLHHVPAHSDDNSKRTYVNNWCDEQAKAAMKAALQVIKK
jgi:ribonuclease HI